MPADPRELVQDLRDRVPYTQIDRRLMRAAADEIERLRAVVEPARLVLNACRTAQSEDWTVADAVAAVALGDALRALETDHAG